MRVYLSSTGMTKNLKRMCSLEDFQTVAEGLQKKDRQAKEFVLSANVWDSKIYQANYSSSYLEQQDIASIKNLDKFLATSLVPKLMV